MFRKCDEFGVLYLIASLLALNFLIYVFMESVKSIDEFNFELYSDVIQIVFVNTAL